MSRTRRRLNQVEKRTQKKTRTGNEMRELLENSRTILENNEAFLRNKKAPLENKRTLLENKRATPGKKRLFLENERVILENKRAILKAKGHFWEVEGLIDLRTRALATHLPPPPSVVIFECFKPKYLKNFSTGTLFLWVRYPDP